MSELEDRVLESLESVIDPELGVDIVNLGLIYGVKVDEEKCIVTMTLTTMGCPLSEMINQDIHQAVEAVNGIKSCEINLVWYPEWSVDKMSRFARITLGLYN